MMGGKKLNNKITFIILSWNSEAYIGNCLSSIFNLKKYEVEVIVIDNGSKDSTVSIIENMHSETVLIKLDKNYGTTYTRNLAIKMADQNSEYICILDSDTIINQDAIVNLTECLDKDESYFIAAPRMYNLKGREQISCKRFPNIKIKLFKALPVQTLNEKGSKLESYILPEEEEIVEVDYAISACWMMKKDVFKRVGYLDEAIFYAPEDVDFCARVWEAGGKVVLATKSSIVHDTQRISKRKLISKINLSHLTGLIYYFYKHRYLMNSDKLKSGS
jgi:Predicted glycosyltransferases